MHTAFRNIKYLKDYYIDVFGNVFHGDKKLRHDKKIKIDYIHGFKYYSVDWLYGLTWYDHHLPYTYWDKVDIQIDNFNTDKDNRKDVVFRLKPGTVLHGKKDFAIINDFTRYAINKDGVVIRIISEKIYKPCVGSHGYYTVRVKRDVDDDHLNYPQHRLLALAWLDKPFHYKKMDINHINGVKTDNRLTNIEWVTRTGNNLHAFKSGLRNDCISVYVKNICTGVISKHYSIEECARSLGLDGETIRLRLNNNEQKLYPGYLLFSYDNQWREVINPNHELMNSPFNKCVTVVNKIDNNTHEFKSLKDAGQFLVTNPDTLSLKLKKSPDGIVVNNFSVFYNFSKIC